LNDHLPRKVLFNADFGVLVTGLITGCRSLNELLMRDRKLERAHARTAGTVLAHLHNRAISQDGRSATTRPHTLALNRPHFSLLRNLSPANMRLLEPVQRDLDLSAGLDGLRADWRPEVLIHGDAKLDNIIVSPGAFVLVDWELATLGDPRWDVGTLISSILSAWIASMPVAHGADPVLVADQAWLPTSQVQAGARGVWHAYARARALDPQGSFRDEMIAYCGGRLIQTAYEYMQHAPRPRADAIYMIQIAANILRDPAQAADFLLGVR
jgi:aminoglycoside phosphotransferase (APT) family kinase protein